MTFTAPSQSVQLMYRYIPDSTVTTSTSFTTKSCRSQQSHT